MFKIVLPCTDWDTAEQQVDRIETHVIAAAEGDIITLESHRSGTYSVAIHSKQPQRIAQALFDDGFVD